MKKSNLKTIIISCLLITAICIASAKSQGTNDELVIVTHSGWKITANQGTGMLELSHDSLGLVIKDIRINQKTKKGLSNCAIIHAEKSSTNQLIIQTQNPVSTWMFELNQDLIKISCTISDMVLTGMGIAPKERVVARLLDQNGIPVEWGTTDEIVGSWKGKETRNPSYLPIQNPDVMTFALGQIASSNLNCLFDRKRDIAIIFPEITSMQRNQQDNDILNVTIPIPGNSIIRLIPDYYTKSLGLPFYKQFNDSLFPTAPMVWGSWTAYYQYAKESDIISNTDWLSANLKPYGFQYVQIDDGYDRGKKEGHYWIENWDKNLFPHGPKWMAGYIKSKGMHPGLWLVPNSYAGFYENHPEWYLHDKDGNLVRDYNTPALDFTNPNAREWLPKLFGTLKEWGFEYFKFDGEVALPKYVPAVDNSKLFNSSADAVSVYREKLNIIRNAVGPETFIEGCPAGSPLNGIGYFNSYFNGADMYNSWKGCYAVFSSINANSFLNHIAVYVMPGEGIDVSPVMSVEESKKKRDSESIRVAMLREDPFTGFGTTMQESHTLVTYIALTGVAYPLTSIMPELPDERVRLLKMTLPTMPILPVDLYSRGSDITWDKFKHTTADKYIHNYPEILDLKVNTSAGIYDVVAFTNWRSGTISKEISLKDKLGLENGKQYIAFDFWNQKLLGVYTDSLDIEVESHDTRVISLHPKLNRPQLIGMSRHISGSYSIVNMEWNGQKHVLKGTSQTVKGDNYSLFFYIPLGATITKVSAFSASNHEIKVENEVIGNSLKISFQGTSENVQWQIEF